MAETINTQTTGYECVGIEKIEQTYEGLFDNKPNIITIYLTNGDTHQFKVMNGSQGVGIDRIEQRQTSTVSGGRNEFAIILTNGKEYTFSTYNGSGGSGSSGSFNQVLQQLNNLLMPSGKSYLYYNGSGFEWKSPDGSTGGGTADLSEYSWWGRRFEPESNSITGEMSGVTGIEFQSTNGETVIRKKLHLDNNGDLCFDGNFYATGGITALGSSGSISGGGSNGGTTGILYFGAPNKNLGFNGSKDMSLAFGDGLKVEKNDSQITVSAIGGIGGSGSIQVAQTPEYSGESESWVSATKLRFVGITGTKPTIRPNSDKGCVDVGIPTGGGSGSSGTTSGRLRFYKDSSEESWNGESDFKIIFGSGLNVTWDSHSQITLSATGGGGGGSTSTSVSWENVTNKPSTFTPSSHTHSASDITGLSGVKVSNATNADRLLNSRTIWGQSFNGTSDINGHLYMGTAGGDSIQLYMNNGNMLDRTNNTLHIGYGLKESSDGEINLDAYKTVVYTDNMSRHYDFKSNVFDVNTNAIHFGSGASGGKISWDRTNNAFKIEGKVYATGGITALGVSNNATTSNNVDFTFRSVTINSTNQNKVKLTDEGLVFYTQNIINAYYKKDSIGLYDSANDACCKIFGFANSEFVFDPDRYSVHIVFNSGLSCYTDEDTLNVGNNTTNGYIYFYPGSTMTFKHNDKEYNFNVAKAIEQGILTI